MTGSGFGLFIIFSLAGLYFVPSIIAGTRKVAKGPSILIINLFLGWTLIGWVVALAWAVGGESRRQLTSTTM